VRAFWHRRVEHLDFIVPGAQKSGTTALHYFLKKHSQIALPDREALAATLAPATGAARDGMVTATVAACALLTELLDAARTAVALAKARS